MLEELLIQISSVYNAGGMEEAQADVASMQTASDDMAAAYVANMGEMTDATEVFNMAAAGNLESVNDKVRAFNEDSEAATLAITEGLNPALNGMDTSALQQLGIDMTEVKSKIEETTDSVDKLDNAVAAFNVTGVSNLQGINDQVRAFNENSEEATLSLTEGFNPALNGMDTSKLEQLGIDMTQSSSDTDEASESVDKLSGRFSALQSVGGMALMMLGGLMLGLADKAISAAETVQGSMSKMGGSLGMSATQAIAATPQLEKMALGWSSQTGIDPDQLASSVPILEQMGQGAFNNNTALVNQTMPVIGGLATAMNEDPTQAAQSYGKTITETKPTAMFLAKMGLNLGNLNTASAQEGFGSNFAGDTSTQKVEALNHALLTTGKIAQVNAAYANSSAGRMAIFNAKLQDMEAQVGSDLIPTLTWLMNNFIGPLAGAMAKYPALGTIVALFLVLGGALGLLAGPLMALGQIGPAIQEVKAFGKAIWNLPGTIKNGIGWLQDKFSSLGSSAEDSATKQELLSASQDASGNSAEIDAAKQDILTGSENVAGAGGEVEGAEKGAGFMEDEVGSIGSMSGVVEALAGGFAIAAGAVMSFVGALASATMATLIFLATNPIGWLILLGLAIVAVISYFHLWGPVINGAKRLFSDLGRDAVHALQMIWGGLQQFAADLGNIIPSIINFKNLAVNAAINLVNGFIGYIKQLPGMVYNEFMQIGQYIINVGSTLYNDAVHVGANIVSGLKKAMGINSPGYLYYAVKGELDLMHSTMDTHGSIFNEDGKNLGSSIVTGFTQGTSKSAIKSVATNALNPGATQNNEKTGPTINMYFTQEQNKQSAKDVVEYVKQNLKGINDAKGR